MTLPLHLFMQNSLVVYDWILTLSREVQLFWTGKTRPLSALLYFTNRYLNLLSIVMGILWYAPMSDKLSSHQQVLLRFIRSGIYFPLLGCIAENAAPLSLSTMYVITLTLPAYTNPGVDVLRIMDRISIIVADTLLIAITWKVLSRGASKNTSSQIKTVKAKGLVWTMLYDASATLTELSLVLDGETSLVSVFTGPISSVLVSHFLLDLQEAHQRKVVGLASDDSLHISQSVDSHSVNFAPALGSIGAILDPADYGLDDDNECTGDRLAFPEGVPPSEDESSQDLLIKHELAITEAWRGGGGEMPVGV
ncbi:hypothetical protein LXA43DRAFT_1063459 [Ganoderma leucocontextum]|nr:hypothetical protein LXA43DRAFT_1063459 [Ganoderma leucocontextum]